MSEVLERDSKELRAAEDGLKYAESQHQVPDESMSHHVMDGFIQSQQMAGMSLFKKKPVEDG